MTYPTSYETILLIAAAYRTFRLIGYDTVLNPLRERIVRRSKAQEDPSLYRRDLDVFLHCPWCLGFWSAVGWWLAWTQWESFTIWFAVPFAIAAGVGLITKNLDP